LKPIDSCKCPTYEVDQICRFRVSDELINVWYGLDFTISFSAVEMWLNMNKLKD
jgi:hypothetical protein